MKVCGLQIIPVGNCLMASLQNIGQHKNSFSSVSSTDAEVRYDVVVHSMNSWIIHDNTMTFLNNWPECKILTYKMADEMMQYFKNGWPLILKYCAMCTKNIYLKVIFLSRKKN